MFYDNSRFNFYIIVQFYSGNDASGSITEGQTAQDGTSSDSDSQVYHVCSVHNNCTLLHWTQCYDTWMLQEAHDAGIADASDYSSDAADPAPDVVDASESGEDFETDEDKEAQSDHEEEELRWS